MKKTLFFVPLFFVFLAQAQIPQVTSGTLKRIESFLAQTIRFAFGFFIGKVSNISFNLESKCGIIPSDGDTQSLGRHINSSDKKSSLLYHF